MGDLLEESAGLLQRCAYLEQIFDPMLEDRHPGSHVRCNIIMLYDCSGPCDSTSALLKDHTFASDEPFKTITQCPVLSCINENKYSSTAIKKLSTHYLL